MFKLLKVIALGLFLISAIVLIKYKPMYEITMGNQKIGYVENEDNIDNYLDEMIEEDLKENVAFIDFEEKLEVKLQLVNRGIQSNKQEIIEKLENKISIEYTTYAISYNGKNIVYVSTIEEAEKVVENVKKQYDTKYANKIGILQVYSDNYSEIKPLQIQNATDDLSKQLKKEEKSSAIKMASAKVSNIKGVKFTVKPLSGTITSRFGNRTSPGGIGSTNHKGVDIAAKTGTTIKAAASGTVKFAGYKGSLGNLIIIDNGNGVETYYGHCSKLYVKEGQKIEAGEKIAAVGQTGAATGPHLHLEIHVNGTAVNPQKYVY